MPPKKRVALERSTAKIDQESEFSNINILITTNMNGPPEIEPETTTIALRTYPPKYEMYYTIPVILSNRI